MPSGPVSHLDRRDRPISRAARRCQARPCPTLNDETRVAPCPSPDSRKNLGPPGRLRQALPREAGPVLEICILCFLLLSSFFPIWSAPSNALVPRPSTVSAMDRCEGCKGSLHFMSICTWFEARRRLIGKLRGARKNNGLQRRQPRNWLARYPGNRSCWNYHPDSRFDAGLRGVWRWVSARIRTFLQVEYFFRGNGPQSPCPVGHTGMIRRDSPRRCSCGQHV